MCKEMKNCSTCKWHDDFTGVCFCPDSDEKADFTDPEDKCDCWEKEK